MLTPLSINANWRRRQAPSGRDSLISRSKIEYFQLNHKKSNVILDLLLCNGSVSTRQVQKYQTTAENRELAHRKAHKF